MADETLDGLQLNLDEPAQKSVLFRDSILCARGWAVARSGIETVEISLDGAHPKTATYGILREELEAIYPEFAEASRSGFLVALSSSQLDPGTHTLRAFATSKAGARAQVEVTFEVDPRMEYEVWASLNAPTQDQLLAMVDRYEELAYRPKISIVTPVYRTPEDYLRGCVSSVKRQAYPNWELVLVDDGSDDRRLTGLLESFAAGDRRIRVSALADNRGIANASNAGLALCQGEYVGFLDHDDELSPDALYRVAKALNADSSLDVLYSDEDKISETGSYQNVFFKPDWSPDLLLSLNYVCHFLVARRALLERVGGFRPGFEGSQDYDLILRLSEHTQKIHRISRVLYHWRVHPQSTASGVSVKPAASDAGRRALKQHLERRGIPAEVSETNPCRYRVKYALLDKPEVAIVIPTGGSATLVPAIESIFNTTTYRNYKIVVADNSKSGTVEENVRNLQAHGKPVQILDYRDLSFNFSYLCNQAAQSADAPYLLFLNDDTSIITPDWIEAMLEHAQRKEVGAVGAQLLFPNNTLQHGGVVVGLMGWAGHAFRGLPPEMHYFGLSQFIRNCSAVTGACLLTRRNVFEMVNGFDEQNLPTCFQDVDLCLKMIEQGYRIVYTPFARLYHYESYSKKAITHLSRIAYMRERWFSFIDDDPFYNPNLTRRSEDYRLNYDHLFQQSGKASIQFYASPNPSSPVGTHLGQTTLFWTVDGVKRVQIRVASPTGALLAEGGASGSASTGPWVEPDMAFYLLDASKTDTPSPEKVLAMVQVAVGLEAHSDHSRGKAHHG
ncbi:MAG: glycosyltransferase family 2 protein [Bryobacteraceae bacterium]